MNQLDILKNASIPLVVFGLAPRSKEPNKGESFLDVKTSDWEDLTKRVKAGQNLGLRTGAIEGQDWAILVLDLDQEKPPAPGKPHTKREWDVSDDGKTLILPQCKIPLPETAWVQVTGRGGVQLFFKVPATDPVAQVGGNNSKVAGCVDWKSHNGYVVLPESVHPDTGNRYQWTEGRSPADLPEPAPLPDELREALLATKSNKGKGPRTLKAPKGPCPEKWAVKELLTTPRPEGESGPKIRKAEWHKRLLRLLKTANNRKGATDAVKLAYRACTGELKPPPKGGRDEDLCSIIGTLAYYLADDPAATADHLLACLDPYLEQILPPWEKDPYANAWDKISRFLQAEEEKAEKRAIEEAEEEKARQAAGEKLLERYRQAHPSLKVETFEEMLRHLFLIDGRGNYYILRPSGYYEESPVTTCQVLDTIRSHWRDGEDFPVSLIGYTAEGFPYDLPVSEVVKGRCFKIHPARFTHKLCVKGLSVGLEEGGPMLLLPRGWPRSLSVKRWPIIAQFLNSILTAEQQRDLALWVLGIIRFPKLPAALLAFIGVRGCGKSILSLALGGLYIHASGSEGGATAKTFGGRFDGSFSKNAFLRIEESTEQASESRPRQSNYKVCDLLTGQIDVEPKGKEVINLSEPMKMVFTCNDVEAFKRSFTAGVAPGAEAEALAIRCRVMEFKNEGKDGAKFFKGENPEGLVDFALTQKEGEEWVGKSGPQILRQHLLWMAEESAKDPENLKKAQIRLGVGGNALAIIEEAQYESASVQDVVQVICDYGRDFKDYLRQKRWSDLRLYEKGQLLVDGEIWITAREVRELLKAQDLKTPGPSRLRQILLSLAVPGLQKPRKTKIGRTKNVYIYRLDLERFSKIAGEAGNSVEWAENVLEIDRLERDIQRNGASKKNK